MNLISGTCKNGAFYFDSYPSSGVKVRGRFTSLFYQCVKVNIKTPCGIKTYRLDFSELKHWSKFQGLKLEKMPKLKLISNIHAFIYQKNGSTFPFLTGKYYQHRLNLEPWLTSKGIKKARLIDRLFFRSVTFLAIVDGRLKTVHIRRKSLIKWMESVQIPLNPDLKGNEALVYTVQEHANAIIKKQSEEQQLQTKPKENPVEINKPLPAIIPGVIKNILICRLTYNKKGEIVPGTTQEEKRLVFDKWQNDPRFSLKVLSEASENTVQVLCDDEENELINVDATDLSRRLHLSLSRIKKYAGKGNLNAYMDKKVLNMDVVIDYYERILKKMQGLEKQILSPAVLMKIVRLLVKKGFLKQGSKDIQKLQTIEINDWKIACGFSDEKKLLLLDLASLTFYNKGAAGTIYTIKSFLSDRLKVIKIACGMPDYILENEYYTLKHFHGYGREHGLQKAPQMLFRMKIEAEQKSRYAFLCHKYEGNLLQAAGLNKKLKPIKHDIFTTFGKKFNAIYQLVCNFERIYRTKLLHHGDIKLENVFYEVDKEGMVQLFLADFGGASVLDEKRGFHLESIAAPQYLPEGDLNAIFSARQEGNQGFFNQVAHKMDVYALGCLLYEFFSHGQIPYDPKQYVLRADYFPERKIPPLPTLDGPEFNRKVLESLPEELIEIIAAMTNLDYEKRICLTEVKDRLDEFKKSSQL